ncbi:hypothetical protein KEM55_000439 [Ascosphaera atra]|nr:hypothetical protein KEM55_000439 [Ascosphaera atra]
MGSTVHFKFKSQKDFTRVAFDGTGISVFELKREIITLSKLGDGSDFELAIYNADTGEEYADDTTLVPRTTRVIARRLPPARPGKGGAARYVSGRMPANAKSVPKADAQGAGQAAGAPASQVINNAQSEEEKIKALLNLQESQWKVQQEEMAKYVNALVDSLVLLHILTLT